MPQEQSLPRPSDKWIPWYFFAFFFGLVLILVPMCIIAVTTNPGTVTEHPYEEGLAYNKAIHAAEQQKSLNWHGDVTVTPDGAGKNVIVEFALKDSAGAPINDAVVTLYMVRPMQADMDQKVDVKFVQGGRYHAELSLPAHGLWEARISASRQSDNFQVIKRISIP